MPTFRLKRDQTALLVIDIQERLCAAMERDALDRMINRTNAVIEGAKALELPIIVTEQYPKGLGPTHSLVKMRLGSYSAVEKVEFSACVPDVAARLGERKQVLLVGMETHVCVFQTVRDLTEKGFTPLLCADAVMSRYAEDRRVGLEMCRDAGAHIVTVEAALFDLLGCAGTPEFKKVSAAVR
ncbi:isochorismatase family protein [Vitiosangium sp. GDMCC 1.1324]|uniref:isochorismatase family protein n=1 Tax=Vitiosangium sp. (strain GDMCC 1.1324) TaxID=2138576 RepID=UPI000D38BF28|nr:isochorismatase family protein [Vitiosangium sp. GDMCC 1.1324]PTL78209.1 hydrolase [Vitiosangium sp. GDMCC 1.1324]